MEQQVDKAVNIGVSIWTDAHLVALDVRTPHATRPNVMDLLGQRLGRTMRLVKVTHHAIPLAAT